MTPNFTGFAVVADEVRNLAIRAAASTEQSQGIDQISIAVSQMDKVTQLNAANAEDLAAASEETDAQALRMKQNVEELENLVGRAKTGRLDPRRPAGPARPTRRLLPERTRAGIRRRLNACPVLRLRGGPSRNRREIGLAC
ncbi:MAG: hypothetical protein V1816_08310 [Pseudomonadota bacterium]